MWFPAVHLHHMPLDKIFNNVTPSNLVLLLYRHPENCLGNFELSVFCIVLYSHTGLILYFDNYSTLIFVQTHLCTVLASWKCMKKHCFICYRTSTLPKLHIQLSSIQPNRCESLPIIIHGSKVLGRVML